MKYLNAKNSVKGHGLCHSQYKYVPKNQNVLIFLEHINPESALIRVKREAVLVFVKTVSRCGKNGLSRG